MYLLVLLPLLLLGSLVAIFSMMYENPDRVLNNHYPYVEIRK